MRHIKEILRLKHEHRLSVREIGRSCGQSSSTVNDYLNRAEAAGLKWPFPEGLSEEEIHRLLLEGSGQASPPTAPLLRPLPDWPEVHKELGRRSVTLRLLWEEYRQAHPNGYGYTQFCEYYNRWAQTLDPVMRHPHVPGEKMFVDWAGQKVPILSPDGVAVEASIFIAVLGASNMTFTEAFENEKLPAWIAGHCHAYAFFQGVARVTVPDNLKTGVTAPCRYEPRLHRTYQEMSEHYGAVIIPARPKKPRDQAKAEAGVLIAERRILAALRNQAFFSVAELNQAMEPKRGQS